MFFVLSKTLGFFAIVSNALIALALIGLMLLWAGRHRSGTLALTVAVAGLALAAWSPLGSLLLAPLEARFAPPAETGPAPDGIVILGGSSDTGMAAERGGVDLNESAERLFVALDLARRYPQARVVFSGGEGRLARSGLSEAAVAARFFAAAGLDPARIVLEDRSRNTIENAQFSRDLIQPKADERWFLITSGFHMPRSVGCFRAVGFPVIPYPVDWRTLPGAGVLWPRSSATEGLRRTDVAVREWIGLVVYRATGRIGALFPAP